VSLEVSHVPSQDVDFVWDQIEEHVKRGLRHAAGDSLTSDYLRESIRLDRKLLWVVHDKEEVVAAIVLEIVRRPAKNTLYVVLAAGRDFHLWVDQVNNLLRDFAAIIGVDSIEASTRIGMAKWLKEAGWNRKAILMELPHERR